MVFLEILWGVVQAAFLIFIAIWFAFLGVAGAAWWIGLLEVRWKGWSNARVGMFPWDKRDE